MTASLSCFGVFEVACRHCGSWFEQSSVFGKSNIFCKEWPQVLFIAELHHIFPLNYSKWSIGIKIWKERKKMNLKYIYWKNPWSEVSKLSSSWPESMEPVSSLKPKILYFYLRLHRYIYERRQGTIFGEIEVY